MALTEQQKQKKRQQRAQKRKLAIGSRAKMPAWGSAKARALNYARYPVFEVLCPDTLNEQGIGNLFFSRQRDDGQIGVSVFLLDVYCLGVKNALFSEVDETKYEEMKDRMLYGDRGEPWAMHPTCLRKLVEAGIAYARDLGFEPHKDYRAASGIFGDVDPQLCPSRFEFGREGKPFYVSGPNDSPAFVRKVMRQLHRHCGVGGYDYLTEIVP